MYLAAGKGRERERKDGRLREDTKKEGQAGKAKASEVVSSKKNVKLSLFSVTERAERKKKKKTQEAHMYLAKGKAKVLAGNKQYAPGASRKSSFVG